MPSLLLKLGRRVFDVAFSISDSDQRRREAEHIKETEKRENSGPRKQGEGRRRESVIARLFAHQHAFARKQQMGTRPTRRRTDCARAESQGKADGRTDCACNLSRVTSRNAPRERSLRFWPALHTANNANGHLCSGERENWRAVG